MKTYCVLANDSVEFIGRPFSKLPGKTHYLSLGCSKLKDAHPVNFFLDFGAKILRIAHLVNYSYLPPWLWMRIITPRKRLYSYALNYESSWYQRNFM